MNITFYYASSSLRLSSWVLLKNSLTISLLELLFFFQFLRK